MTELLNRLQTILRIIKMTVAENKGFFCITGLLALLLGAAVLLSMGLVSLVEPMATCAYFALVIGVLLELIGFGKNKFKGVVLDASS